MDVVVIGGGIVGASAAYRLARAGARVTLVDRADQGYATAAGAGIISPGTSLRPPPAFYPLAAASTAYYPCLLEQLAEDGETDTGYDTPGALFVATNEDEAERLSQVQQIAQERRAQGVQGIGDVAVLTGAHAQTLFPALADVPIALHITGSSRVNGRLMRTALQRAAETRGATIVRGSARLRVHDDHVAVEVEDRGITADAVIIAAGAWSKGLGEDLGITVPVYPQRGQILHMDMPESETGPWPIVLGFHSHYIVTFPPHRVVAGATREDDSGYDYRITAGGVHEVTGEALRVAPGLASATFREVRVGLRPATHDNLPILGRVPRFRNVYLATGLGASGLQNGPFAGAVVADLAMGREVELDLAPFSLDRFGA